MANTMEARLQESSGQQSVKTAGRFTGANGANDAHANDDRAIEPPPG